ncbi:MAG: GTPase ObgE [Chloroflexota bacterium]
MIDRASITVKAGDGGNGAISFRREKFVPYGGPDGGDGGKGGDVVIRADASVTDLRRFKIRSSYKAAGGGNGSGAKKHGRDGGDLVLNVPPGTVVSLLSAEGDGGLLADLEQPGQSVVAAAGGQGGRGNTRFASSVNQAPQIAQRGETGEGRSLILELRLIADAGIIGYPNAGKSTLLAAASAARPKIAGYPFTTLEPVLGVVESGQQTFVLAEIPGLIDGAHLGRGLGHDFLRHSLRTRVLVHLIDASSEDPVGAMHRVNAELGLYDSSLARKPQVVAVNKIDLPEVQLRLSQIESAFEQAGVRPFFISAATGRGVTELMAETAAVLSRAAEATAEVPRKLFRPQPRAHGISVRREGAVFVLTAPGLERIVSQGGGEADVHWQLRGRLVRMGVDRALEKAGARPGDRVRCGDLEWEL